MTDFEFKVVVSTDTNDHAIEVMQERLTCDEDYGFNYQVDFESLTERESVFLVWDNEGPELVNVYGSREAAEAHIRRVQEAADYGEISEDQSAEEIAEQVEELTAHLGIEERTVIG